MSDQKRTYKVVTVTDVAKVSIVYVEADKVMITTSGALCFYENQTAQTQQPRKLGSVYHLIEAYAPKTWKHVVEEEVKMKEFESDKAWAQ